MTIFLLNAAEILLGAFCGAAVTWSLCSFLWNLGD